MNFLRRTFSILLHAQKPKMIDIANIVNEITGNHSGIEFVARRGWDKITRRRASIEKARRVLAMNPR